MPQYNGYLTPAELAARLQGAVNVKTLANWRCGATKRGPRFRRFGNKILYPIDGVELWERAQEFGSTHEYPGKPGVAPSETRTDVAGQETAAPPAIRVTAGNERESAHSSRSVGAGKPTRPRDVRKARRATKRT